MANLGATRLIAPAVGGLMALATALGIGRFVFTPILPAMLDALSWTTTEAGLVASANFLGYFVGACLSSRTFMLARARSWLLISLATSVLSTAGMALPSGLAAFLILRLVGGVASAIVIVCASRLVLERLAIAGRNSLSGLHFAGVGFGILLSAGLVSWLVACGAGWRALWIGAGALGLVAAAMAALTVPADAGRRDPAERTSPSQRTGRLGALVIAHGLFGFGYVITATFLVAIVRHSSDACALELWVWMLVGLAAMPSVALWCWLGERVGTLHAYAAACLLEALGVAGSVEWSSVPGIGVAAVLLGGTFMGITALGFLAAQRGSSGQAQRAMGQVTTSFALGQMLGPTFAGYLSEQLGSLRPASLVAAGALLLAAVLAVTGERRGKLRENADRCSAGSGRRLEPSGS
jgi:predicted MFS family arabinose efflux permease